MRTVTRPRKQSTSIYDAIDFQRACQAYLWGFPLVSAASVRRGLFQNIGATYNDLAMYPNYLDAKGLWLTGNTTTIYGAAIIDLAKDGPVVVELPTGPTAGALGDFWFIASAPIGLPGPDKGKGAKFLLIPPGYKGDLPVKGYFITSSGMNDTTFFIRAFGVNNDISGAVALLKKVSIYPYSQRDSVKPNRFFDLAGKFINTLEPEGLEFWRLLSDVINNNPVQSATAPSWRCSSRLASRRTSHSRRTSARRTSSKKVRASRKPWLKPSLLAPASRMSPTIPRNSGRTP